jgi:hypothetical protein
MSAETELVSTGNCLKQKHLFSIILLNILTLPNVFHWAFLLRNIQQTQIK